MAIDWSQPICTIAEPRHYGITMPVCERTGARRVMFSGAVARISDPAKDMVTVWRFSEQGICRVDGQPGPMDVMNTPASEIAA